MGIANTTGYNHYGIDGSASRTMPRELLGYYRGAPATPWAVDDRRRTIVLSGVAGSPTHDQWQIIHNEEFSNAASVNALINSVQPAPAGTDFPTWAASQNLPSGNDGPHHDPDLDGAPNLLEFSSGTNPLNPSSRPFQQLASTPTGFTFTIHRDPMTLGIQHSFHTGPLSTLTPFSPESQHIEISPLPNGLEQVTLSLPPTFGPFIRQTVSLP